MSRTTENKIYSIGIDQHTADLDLRGRFSMSRRYLEEFSREALCTNGIEGVVGLMTCNRNEFYLYGNSEGADAFLELLISKLDLPEESMDHVFRLEGTAAVRRLFRVAGGYESIVAGEDQILGQVKSAIEEAMATGVSCGTLNRLFLDGIRCAKSIRHRTGLSENKLSVSSIGISLLEESYGTEGLKGKTALVIGFGEMSRLGAAYLAEAGVKKLIVSCRNKERLEGFATEAELVWIPYEERYTALEEVDVVVSATGAPHIVLTYENMKRIFDHKASSMRPEGLKLLDMAVPRDIEQQVRNIEGITLFDMDDFMRISDQNLELRRRLLAEQEPEVERAMEEFLDWCDEAKYRELLSMIDGYVEKKVADQAESLLHKLDMAGDREDSARILEYGLRLSERVLRNIILQAKKEEQGEALIGSLYTLLKA